MFNKGFTLPMFLFNQGDLGGSGGGDNPAAGGDAPATDSELERLRQENQKLLEEKNRLAEDFDDRVGDEASRLFQEMFGDQQAPQASQPQGGDDDYDDYDPNDPDARFARLEQRQDQIAAQALQDRINELKEKYPNMAEDRVYGYLVRAPNPEQVDIEKVIEHSHNQETKQLQRYTQQRMNAFAEAVQKEDVSPDEIGNLAKQMLGEDGAKAIDNIVKMQIKGYSSNTLPRLPGDPSGVPMNTDGPMTGKKATSALAQFLAGKMGRSS